MKYIMMLLMVALLAGCAGGGNPFANNGIQSPLDDGYQFGDGLSTVDILQTRYCATADPRRRAIALAALERLGAPIPSRGACTDILEVIGTQDLEALDQIDVESAEQDRQRALERLEGAE